MIQGRDIVFIASIEWDFLWQGHQEIASRLAEAGNRVLYIENTGVRSPGLKDARRVVHRLQAWARSLRSKGVRQVAPNLYVCAPLVLPPFGARWQRQVNRRLLLPHVRRVVRQLGLRDVLLWTYLPTDTALDLIRSLRSPKSAVVYYCIADFAQLTPQLSQLERAEKAILTACDVVFAQGPEIASHCARWNDNVHIFPFGVNLDAFPLAASPLEDINTGHTVVDGTDPDCPPAMRNLPRPVIGYIGGLHRHVDIELLAVMARARPQWSWVFVGPLQTAVDELCLLPNVHLVGHQPHNDLVHYVQRFDVCMVPYVSSSYTDTVVPTKINEYLAVGKPVVSTPLPAVCNFNAKHEILTVAPARPEAFLHAIEQALRAPADAGTLAWRREVATLGDWQARLEAMSELIETQLKKKSRRSKSGGRK
ncbi:MAG: glycosyltransferase [Abitibacteriaceae bacterium]|nr:glycosyltransferase [Abditibacteriaceae bacterium]MBV9868813.1 glycosyltransferase [Abditibacteriaceae bacterium]